MKFSDKLKYKEGRGASAPYCPLLRCRDATKRKSSSLEVAHCRVTHVVIANDPWTEHVRHVIKDADVHRRLIYQFQALIILMTC